MKESFKAFYELSEQELSEIWSNDETVIIFDTNILLSLYEYSQDTRKEFFKIFQIVEDNIWIPFHVALEYQRGRLYVIRKEKASLKKFNTKLDSIKSTVTDEFSDFDFESKHPDLFIMEDKFRENICSLVDSFKTEVAKVDETQPCATEYDYVRDKLDSLLEGKVGEEPEEAWVLQVAKEGATRYDNKIPPGYMDANKDGSSFTHSNIRYEGKFGDLIIWKQILEYLKSASGVKNVIFITNDTKEDWCTVLDISGVKHRIGARPELKSEMYKETEVDSFMMYNSNEFLTAAKKYRNVDVEDKAIEETKHIFESWNTYLNDVEKHKKNIEALATFEKYKKDINALAILEKYKKDNDSLDILEKHKKNIEALVILEKYKKDNDPLDILKKFKINYDMLENFNVNNSDDE